MNGPTCAPIPPMSSLCAAQVVMNFSTLFLVCGSSAILLALVGYVAGSRRVPIILTAMFLVVVALLHNGKSAMRAQYWEANGAHRQVPATELVSFFTEW